ncbi:MAG: glycosyltransferase family 87 protein [Chloroflexi bacterium]|nr:glycosyltransferase family 87 protein [Chloroflexota bacterium]
MDKLLNTKDEPALRRTRLVNFAALSAWLVTSTLMAATALIRFGQDFRVYYAAARLLLKGGNPFDYNQLFPVILQISGKAGNAPYYNPPWLAWFLTPLALLPYQPARAVWILLNLVIWCLGLWQLSRLLDWPPAGWQRWSIFLYATFLFAWVTWRYEQMGIILFALLVAALASLRKSDWAWAGVWLALLLIKPNLTFIPVAAASLWLLRRGRWQPILSMSLVLTGLLLASTAATPDWYRPLLQPGVGSGLVNILDGPNHEVAIRINTTLADWLNMLSLNSTIIPIIRWSATLAAGAILLWVIFRSNSLIMVMICALLANFAVTPYALQYDYPLLTLPLFWATARIPSTARARWGGLAISVFIASVLIWERPISDGYWILLGLIALTAWNWRFATSKNTPISLF